MEKGTAPDLPHRLLRGACLLAVLSGILLALFTKHLNYSIISLLGSAISIAGFMIMIKLTDRFLAKGKGKLLFFTAEVAKAVAIILFFVIFSPLKPMAIVAFILGISVVTFAAVGVGILQIFGMAVKRGA